ncbi:pks15/1 [Symbiodinium sp. CCMP2592]|nr:pks15/1 [Symbiodinium sp. CCMP2592]
MGQLNYSSSNAWLDALSRHRNALGKPCAAPQWGAWGEVGMAANLDDASQRRMAQSPMPPFTNAEGLFGLECGLRRFAGTEELIENSGVWVVCCRRIVAMTCSAIEADLQAADLLRAAILVFGVGDFIHGFSYSAGIHPFLHCARLFTMAFAGVGFFGEVDGRRLGELYWQEGAAEARDPVADESERSPKTRSSDGDVRADGRREVR